MQLDNYPDATFCGNLLNKHFQILEKMAYFKVSTARELARTIQIDMTNRLDRALEEQKSKIEEVLEANGCECGCLAAIRSIK